MEPLKIGNIILPHRAVFGPMAGFTDAPCRRLMAQHEVEIVGAKLRDMMPWIKKNRLVDQSKN